MGILKWDHSFRRCVYVHSRRGRCRLEDTLELAVFKDVLRDTLIMFSHIVRRVNLQRSGCVTPKQIPANAPIKIILNFASPQATGQRTSYPQLAFCSDGLTFGSIPYTP